MLAFQQALESSDLADLGYKGPKYTWKNCYDGQAFTKEHLDRDVANSAWTDMFSEVEVWVDVTPCSDHTPLTLVLTGGKLEGCGKAGFRYEAKWALNVGYKEVKQAWNTPTDGD
jgi:hypothetical protein